jgi:hypothetical protein
MLFLKLNSETFAQTERFSAQLSEQQEIPLVNA